MTVRDLIAGLEAMAEPDLEVCVLVDSQHDPVRINGGAPVTDGHGRRFLILAPRSRAFIDGGF